MKKILLVHAHPEPASFCSALHQEMKRYFEAEGNEVMVSDLYAMGFNPVGDRADFTSLENEGYFKYQAEQVNAYQNESFVQELKSEMDKFEACDLMVFSFPLWWFGLPAILKGWVDRVFAMGFVYGAGKGVYDQGFYKDKKAMLVFTTGGPEMAYGAEGKNGSMDVILYPIQHGMFYFAGMQVLEPFTVFAPVRKSDEEREAELLRLRKTLQTLDTRKILSF